VGKDYEGGGHGLPPRHWRRKAWEKNRKLLSMML